MPIYYAKGFDILYEDNYKTVVVYNPWNEDEIQQTYFLVNNDTIQTPSYGIKILIPIDNVAISSSTHVEFLNLLGELSTVKGVCTPHLIYNDTLRSRYAAGQIQSLGDAHNVNLEQLLHLRPDVYFAASYNQQDEQAKRLQQSGVNLVFNNEWTESSLLARAEWIKFVAAFYDKEAMADTIFTRIEYNYEAAKTIAQSVEQKPTVMAGGNFKGTWYMPSGASYMARLFADAGADYFYKDETSTSASLALNFETVLTHFHDADVWLNAPTTTLDALYQMDSRHNLFRSAREGRVYAFYRRTLPDGANDFWESAVARPDLVLKDLIWALHPNLLPDYTPTYIIQLN
jgi:iron complex transport system substrate-binding protein